MSADAAGTSACATFRSPAVPEMNPILKDQSRAASSKRYAQERSHNGRFRLNQTIRHLFVIASAFASLLSAQAPIGNISGVVRDPSGAVKAISTPTSAVRTAATNAEGYFLLSTLQPGEYRIQATAPGFSEATVDRVTVEVGQTARIEISLALSSVSTQVQVGGEAVQVDTERATVGGVVTTKEIDQLPLNGRNYLELARLEPGVEIQDGKTF